MFSMQLLNMFHLLNDLNNCFFNEGYESVKSVFIAVATCIICRYSNLFS